MQFEVNRTMDLGLLYEEFESTLLHIVRRDIRNVEAAEDIVHDTFIRALSSSALLDTLVPAQKRAWLIQVAKNIAIDRARARVRADVLRGSVILAWEVQSGPVENSVSTEELLASLSARDAEIVRLKLVDGSTTLETAAHFQIPHSTVRSRLHLIFKKIRKEWKTGDTDEREF